MAKEIVKVGKENGKKNVKGGKLGPLAKLSDQEMAKLVKELPDFSYEERRKIAKKYRGYKYHEDGKRIHGIHKMMRVHNGNQWILNYMIYADCGPTKRTQFKSKLLVALCFTPEKEYGLWILPEQDELHDVLFLAENRSIYDANPQVIDRLKYSNLDALLSLSLGDIYHRLDRWDYKHLHDTYIYRVEPTEYNISNNINLVEAYLNFPQIEQFYRLNIGNFVNILTRKLIAEYIAVKTSRFEEKAVNAFCDILAAVRLALKKDPLLYNDDNKFSIWWDTVKGYQMLGKDIRNPKYYYFTAEELMKIHDKVMEKIRRIRSEEEAIKDNAEFQKLKGRYIGLEMTDGDIIIKTLSSPMEYIEESRAMHNCIEACKYYMKPNSLILCATKNGKRLADIELDLRDYRINQCYGRFNTIVAERVQIENLIKANHDEITRRKSSRPRSKARA